jgi:hypothetical protein
MNNTVQLRVQLPCSYVQLSVSPSPCLPISKLHACTRAARLPHGIGSIDLTMNANEVTLGLAAIETGIFPTLIRIDNRLPQLLLGIRDGSMRGSMHGNAPSEAVQHQALQCEAPPVCTFGTWRNCDLWRSRNHQAMPIPLRKDPGGGGVGADQAARVIIDLPAFFRGPSKKSSSTLATVIHQ